VPGGAARCGRGPMLAVPARQTSVSPHLVRFSRAARCDRQARSALKETDSAHTHGVPSCGPARTVVPSTSPSTLDACLRNRHNDRAPLDLHAGRGISASLPVGRKLNPGGGMSKMLFDRAARPHRLGEALQTPLFGRALGPRNAGLDGGNRRFTRAPQLNGHDPGRRRDADVFRSERMADPRARSRTASGIIKEMGG
jgi:hypothetical protein